jgi:predicted glycosyltransferase involved in capsule biosynthesis
MKISVLIPFKDAENRSDQFKWLHKRWESLGKDFEIVVSSDDGNIPFSKTIAVNNAYRKSTSDILAMVDADVWLDPQILLDAADFIRKSPNSWVRPCEDVYRVNRENTNKILSISPDDPFPNITKDDCERISGATGGVFIFSKKQFETVGGMDSRFRGWGGEDNAWNTLMDSRFSEAVKWNKNLYHLWHPRDRDDSRNAIWTGQSQRNTDLAKEYDVAATDKALLDKIIKENKQRTGI